MPLSQPPPRSQRNVLGNPDFAQREGGTHLEIRSKAVRYRGSSREFPFPATNGTERRGGLGGGRRPRRQQGPPWTRPAAPEGGSIFSRLLLQETKRREAVDLGRRGAPPPSSHALPTSVQGTGVPSRPAAGRRFGALHSSAPRPVEGHPARYPNSSALQGFSLPRCIGPPPKLMGSNTNARCALQRANARAGASLRANTLLFRFCDLAPAAGTVAGGGARPGRDVVQGAAATRALAHGWACSGFRKPAGADAPCSPAPQPRPLCSRCTALEHPA